MILPRAALGGAAAGLAGAAAMALTARAEQLATRRPSSFVPAHTLAHLLGLHRPDEDHVAHKAVFALVTGAVADALTGAAPTSAVRRRTALGARLRGFA